MQIDPKTIKDSLETTLNQAITHDRISDSEQARIEISQRCAKNIVDLLNMGLYAHKHPIKFMFARLFGRIK